MTGSAAKALVWVSQLPASSYDSCVVSCVLRAVQATAQRSPSVCRWQVLHDVCRGSNHSWISEAGPRRSGTQMEQETLAFDTASMQWLHQLSSPANDVLMHGVSVMGPQLLAVVVIAALGAPGSGSAVD
jgi:hypothetical protein